MVFLEAEAKWKVQTTNIRPSENELYDCMLLVTHKCSKKYQFSKSYRPNWLIVKGDGCIV